VTFLGRAALWHQQSKTRRGWPASPIFGYCSPMPNLPPAPPMTLDNMRENGVRTLAVWCLGRGCNHHRVVDVSGYPDDLSVPSFGPRLRCEVCGHRGADVRPNWNEMYKQEPITRACGTSEIKA
jgi:hypothetical protein